MNQAHLIFRRALLLTAFLTAAISGCAVVPTQVPAPQTPAHPLPFKGRLVEGDPSRLPPALAMSLSSTSQVTFHYREVITHDENHISTVEPLTSAGAPLGDYGITAVASLSIMDGDRSLGDYTETVHASQPYNLYSEPARRDLEQAVVAAVRDKMDQRLYSDADRLTQAIASTLKPQAEPAH